MYANKKVQQEYQQLWYLKKIGKLEGNPSEIIREKYGVAEKTKYDPQTRKQKRRESSVLSGKNWRQKKRDIKKACLGECCVICQRKYRNLQAHKKDGEKHKGFQRMGYEEYKQTLLSGEYVLLCYRCHKGVHFCMDILKMKFEDIMIAVK